MSCFIEDFFLETNDYIQVKTKNADTLINAIAATME